MSGHRTDESRIRTSSAEHPPKGAVVYLMERDLRIQDNWAMVHAQDLAINHKSPILILCLTHIQNLHSNRQRAWKLPAIEELSTEAQRLNIGFAALDQVKPKPLQDLLRSLNPGALVVEGSPLIESRRLKDALSSLSIPTFEIDTHNIVPVWVASPKQEYAARTLRPKIERLLDRYLTPFPQIQQHPVSVPRAIQRVLRQASKIKNTSHNILRIPPGRNAAKRLSSHFIRTRLNGYDADRNDPSLAHTSGLSPYLHTGILSAQALALEVQTASAPASDKKAFLEELIVRRELSENYCYYQRSYNSTKGFPDWAKKTLEKHRLDRRQYTYTGSQLDHAETHDPYWNVAQTQLRETGLMHPYMRMYWGKKFLEWTGNYKTALRFANDLNDRYALDGMSPNGYVGTAWCIGGLHDRPWGERDIFGTIRYMNDKGLNRKFNMEAYVAGVGDGSLLREQSR